MMPQFFWILTPPPPSRTWVPLFWEVGGVVRGSGILWPLCVDLDRAPKHFFPCTRRP